MATETKREDRNDARLTEIHEIPFPTVNEPCFEVPEERRKGGIFWMLCSFNACVRGVHDHDGDVV